MEGEQILEGVPLVVVVVDDGTLMMVMVMVMVFPHRRMSSLLRLYL